MIQQFLNKQVTVKLFNGQKIKGKLIAVGKSKHKGWGNLILETPNGTVIIRGSKWHTIATFSQPLEPLEETAQPSPLEDASTSPEQPHHT